MKEDHIMQRLLKIREVAETLAVSESTVSRLVRDNAIPKTWIGRSVRIRPEDLEQFIQARTLNSSTADGPF